MNNTLSYRDTSLLSDRGFSAASLWSWFGKDIDKQEWQVQESEDNGLLQFRQVLHTHTGAWQHMNRNTFDRMFP